MTAGQEPEEPSSMIPLIWCGRDYTVLALIATFSLITATLYGIGFVAEDSPLDPVQPEPPLPDGSNPNGTLLKLHGFGDQFWSGLFLLFAGFAVSFASLLTLFLIWLVGIALVNWWTGLGSRKEEDA